MSEYIYKLQRRLKDKGVRFFACDNISDHLSDEELKYIRNKTVSAFEDVLTSLLIDIDEDPNSQDTARRLADMYIDELFAGRYQPAPKVTAFPNEEPKYEGMLVIRAELNSLCAHHHQPMNGVAYIGVIPNGQVIGLSKYIRIAQWCARRGTLQEELCNHISQEIKKATGSQDVGVYIEMTHGCCENRGVRAYSSLTQTTVLSGQFHESDVKNEFFQQIALQKSK